MYLFVLSYTSTQRRPVTRHLLTITYPLTLLGHKQLLLMRLLHLLISLLSPLPLFLSEGREGIYQTPQGESCPSPSWPSASAAHGTSVSHDTDLSSQPVPLELIFAQLQTLQSQVQDLQAAAFQGLTALVMESSLEVGEKCPTRSPSSPQKHRKVLSVLSFSSEEQLLPHPLIYRSALSNCILISAEDWEQRRLCLLAFFQQESGSHFQPSSPASKRCQTDSSSSLASSRIISPGPAPPSVEVEPSVVPSLMVALTSH